MGSFRRRWVCGRVVVTTRKAIASMHSTVQRCQDVQVPDLVLVETGPALGGLEGLLDGPPLPGDPDQFAERDRVLLMTR